MKYNVGDKLKIKSWKELFNEFGLNKDCDIDLPEYNWPKRDDSKLPQDRIITIDHIDRDGDICYNKSCLSFIAESLIKCHANEYYLQQIKEEIDGKKDII